MQTTPAMIAIAVPTVERIPECTHHLGCTVLVIAWAKRKRDVRLRSSGRSNQPGSKVVPRQALYKARAPGHMPGGSCSYSRMQLTG